MMTLYVQEYQKLLGLLQKDPRPIGNQAREHGCTEYLHIIWVPFITWVAYMQGRIYKCGTWGHSVVEGPLYRG